MPLPTRDWTRRAAPVAPAMPRTACTRVAAGPRPIAARMSLRPSSALTAEARPRPVQEMAVAKVVPVVPAALDHLSACGSRRIARAFLGECDRTANYCASPVALPHRPATSLGSAVRPDRFFATLPGAPRPGSIPNSLAPAAGRLTDPAGGPVTGSIRQVARGEIAVSRSASLDLRRLAALTRGWWRRPDSHASPRPAAAGIIGLQRLPTIRTRGRRVWRSSPGHADDRCAFPDQSWN